MVLVTGYKNDELRIVTWGQEMIMTIDFGKHTLKNRTLYLVRPL